jgi:hypothetical protein
MCECPLDEIRGDVSKILGEIRANKPPTVVELEAARAGLKAAERMQEIAQGEVARAHEEARIKVGNLPAIQAELRRFREIAQRLREYVEHHPDCQEGPRFLDESPPRACTCGLDKVLARIERPDESEAV